MISMRQKVYRLCIPLTFLNFSEFSTNIEKSAQWMLANISEKMQIYTRNSFLGRA